MKMILLAVLSVCLVSLGYAMMGGLDRFLDSGGFDEERRERAAVALVFVNEQRRAQVEHALAQRSEWLRYISEPSPPGEPGCAMVLAASENDLDNILLCARMRKAHPVYAVALCNNPQYLFVYRDYGIEHVARSMDEALEQFERCLKERFECND